MESFGDRLKLEREKQDFTLDQVEEDTKIRKHYLHLLEQEDFATLPARVYAVGFVRRYARFLGLNENELVEEFKALAYNDSVKEEKYFSTPFQQADEPIGGKMFTFKNIFSALIFLVLAVWLGNMMVDFFIDRMDLEPQPSVSYTNNLAQEKDDVAKEMPVSEEAPDENQTVNIMISAHQDCWLQIHVDGEEKYSAILLAGEEISFEGEKTIYLKAGNAGGLEIIYNGVEIPPIGNYGQVVEKEFALGGQENKTEE